MYDKRYTSAQIKTERWWAGFNMFFVMAFLCWGVGKVAYSTGYNQGYHEGRFLVPATDQTSYHVQEASFTIEKMAVPGEKSPIKAIINWILKYWIVAALVVAAWAFYKVATYPRRNSAHVIGSDNAIVQSHSEIK